MTKNKTGSLPTVQTFWDRMTLTERLAWMVFACNTLGILTLIEILILKK